MTLTDAPMIAFGNMLVGAVYTMLLGVDNPQAPLSNAWSWDTQKPALPTADANGVVSFSFVTPLGVGYGMDAFSNFIEFGFHQGFGGVVEADTLILGASRHLEVGRRFSAPATIEVFADAMNILSVKSYASSNASEVLALANHTYPINYTITISGLTPNFTANIPELFFGAVMRMPFLEFGYNEYGEVTKSTVFPAGSGRDHYSRKYRRMELRPKWKNIEPTLSFYFLLFIEQAIEENQPFWWAWAPISRPSEVYLMQHKGGKVNKPLRAGMRFDTSLYLVEAV